MYDTCILSAEADDSVAAETGGQSVKPQPRVRRLLDVRAAVLAAARMMTVAEAPRKAQCTTRSPATEPMPGKTWLLAWFLV